MGFAEVVIVVLVVVIILLFLLSRAARPLSGPSPAAPTVRPSIDPATSQQIGELIVRGRKIEAIKVLRDATGLGLKDSKDWVEHWDGGTPAAQTAPAAQPAGTRSADEILAIEARAVRDASGPIAAIKHVRQRTGWGLAEAKAYVDRLG